MTTYELMEMLLPKPKPIGITAASMRQIEKVHKKNKRRRWNNGGRRKR